MKKVGNKSAIGIMFRIPEYGMVKQRLAAQIGRDEALKAYSSMLYETINNISKIKGIDIFGFYEGRVSQQEGLLKNFATFPQHGNDLGEKMLNAVNRIFNMGYDKAILIGSDSPDTPVSFITDAFEQLDSHRLVIGPSSDGGYYLIGMNSPVDSVFKGINWGHHNVLKETISAAEEEGISYFLLPEWYDIDDLDTLMRWKSFYYTASQ